MNTCINCGFRDQEDGVCYKYGSPMYMEEVDATIPVCDSFEPEDEAENKKHEKTDES